MHAQSHVDRIAHTMMEPTKAQAQRMEFAALEAKAPATPAPTEKETLIHPFDRVAVELIRAQDVVAAGIHRSI